MQRDLLEQLITHFLNGQMTAVTLLAELTATATADLGHTQLDLDRRRRCGYAEVIYGPGKPPQAVVDIIGRLLAARLEALVTRVTADQAAAVQAAFPTARHNEIARTLRVPCEHEVESPSANISTGISPGENPARQKYIRRGIVTIVTAGTTDLPVAEEARETADWMGSETRLICDVGVAGPQRLIAKLPELQASDAIVVAAGMEGALPSVIGGYVRCPVIAVPTSVGYGAAFGGVAALLGMLNSCAANVSVVNIDAGFKAGYVAALIANGKAPRE